MDRRYIKTARPSDKLDDKKLGPFKVIAKRGTSYELELLSTMRIHSVFHSWLLRKDPQDPLPGQTNEPPGPIVLGDNLEWEVDEILDSRTKGRAKRLQYRVKWAGWPHDRAWYYVDDGQFSNAVDVVNEYHRLQSSKPGSLQSNSTSSN